MEEFRELLKTYDWTHDYSDDHQVWLRGNRQQKKLNAKYKELLETIPEAELVAVWNEYAPKMFKR